MKYMHATLVALMIILTIMMVVDMLDRWYKDTQPKPLTSYEVTSDNGMLRSECKVYETGLTDEPIPGSVEYR